MDPHFKKFHIICGVCYCGDISTPRNVTQNETNCDWLFDMLVKRSHGRSLTNESCHLFQTFSRQSEGLAMRDYRDQTTTRQQNICLSFLIVDVVDNVD